MLALGDRALQTWVECIATEECHHIWQAYEALSMLVVLTESLESRYATDRILRACFDMVDVVVVDKP